MNYPHWHIMLNHIPIIGMISGAILWFLAMRTNQAILYKTALGWVIVSAAIAIPVYLTGQNSHELLHGLPGISHEIIDVHERWGTYTLFVSVITGILAVFGFVQLKKLGQLSSTWKVIISLLVVVLSGIAGYTGHLGGLIRHTEIRPGFVPTQEGVEEEGENHHKNEQGEHEHHHEHS